MILFTLLSPSPEGNAIDKTYFTRYIINMITDADIEKLKTIFATKEDLVAMGSKLKKEILTGVADYLESRIIILLNAHEKRIDRLEKHVGGFSPIA